MFSIGLILASVVPLPSDEGSKKLQGTWQAEKIVSKGREISGDRARAITFVVEGDSIKRFVNGVDRNDPATFKADTSTKPAHLDLTSAKEGDPKMLGIFELDGDTLKWCFAAGKRPDKFEAPEGSNVTLIILKRVKK